MVKISDLKQVSEIKEEKQQFSSYSDLLNVDIFKFKTSQFSDRLKDRFFAELSILLDSGIDIHTAFEIILEGAQKPIEKETYSSIKKTIVEGGSLYLALSKTGKFSQYDSASVKIGEETGQLAVILSELSNYYSRKIKQQRLLMKAISYPIVVLITAVSALIFMLSFVVPMFEDIFFRANKELPVFTRYIIKLSYFFRHDILYVLIVPLIFVLLFYYFRSSLKIRRFVALSLLRTPIIGNLVRLFLLEKLYHSLALLVRAKVPVHEALSLVCDIIKFVPVNELLLKVNNDVMAGGGLADAMGKVDFFDRKSIVLIKIGEEVNKLDEIFEKLYLQTSENLEHQISQFGNTVEPLLIIIVGAFVAMILVAMYLPIFQMGTSVF